MKSIFLHAAFILFFTVFLVACDDEEKNIRNLGETELYFDERLSSISLDGDSAFWIGSEAGDVWYMQQRHLQSYNIGVDRIYKVLTDSVLSDGKICWIGIRNSGLQRWKLAADNSCLMEKYSIPNKGYNYSVYDILSLKDKIYVATSQGLYVKSCQGAEELKLLYPSDSSETACSGKPYIVNNIRLYGKSHLLCATQEGLVSIDLQHDKVQVFHADEPIYNVSVYDNKVYLLTRGKLYIEDIAGVVENEVALKFSPRIYYKLGAIHYFLNETHLFLSDDLQSFLQIPLRRKTPQFCNNVVATDRLNGFTLLLTENALWNIPLHLGIFNANGEIVASCVNENTVYYVNSNNELYKQHIGETIASKIWEMPDNESVYGLMADNRYVYYITNKQVLKRIKVNRKYLGNMLFSSAQILYQSPTKITAFCLKKESQGSRVYLGIQDDLVCIDENGNSALVDALHNKYITSFYLSPHTDKLYISTLNDGVFYGSGDKFQVIKGTEDKTFIRDISVTEGHNALLMVLTNHYLFCQEKKDSIPLKSFHKLLKVNDTLFYALPEYGLMKFFIGKEGIKECGSYFKDIRFNPKAAFALNDTLYLGSNIGVLKQSAFTDNVSQWIDMETSVPSIRYLLVIIAFTVVVLLIIVLEYFRRKHSKRKAIKTHLDDISGRLDSLSLMVRYSGNDVREVEKLKSMFTAIDINAPDVSEQIKHLSEQIMKKNRDTALVLSKYLEKQIMLIGGYEVFEKNCLIETSRKSLASDNLEQIFSQIETNEKWLNDISCLKERMGGYKQKLEGTVCIEGINANLFRDMDILSEAVKRKKLFELSGEVRNIDAEFNHIFTEDALSIVADYILKNMDKLRCLEPDNVTQALIAELEQIHTEMKEMDRIDLLKTLYPINCYLEQVFLRDKICRLMCAYVSVRNKVERENEERITKKFDTRLNEEIAEKTQEITDNLEKCIALFYEQMSKTDKYILTEVLEITNFNNQPAKVLALLMGNPRVKRLYIPGMLNVYGNLNPVISRLVNNKLKVNDSLLKEYVKNNPKSMVFYFLRLIA